MQTRNMIYCKCQDIRNYRVALPICLDRLGCCTAAAGLLNIACIWQAKNDMLESISDAKSVNACYDLGYTSRYDV